MGRWKYDNSGQLAWDANDSGPDQGTPTAAQQQAQQSPTPGVYTPGNPPPYLTPGAPPQTASAPIANNWGDARDQSTPEQGYYTDGGMHSDVYTPAQAHFDDLYNNDWAPSRSADLAAARAGGTKSVSDLVGSATPTGTEWWNQGKPSSSWTSTPGNDMGLPSGTTPQPATSTSNQPGQSGPWNGAGVPAGFDAAKWNDPTKNDPKYDIGHMVAGGWTNDSVRAYMQQHPDEFKGYTMTGDDTITGPDGAVYDFRNAVGSDPKGLGTAQWTQVGGPSGSASTAPGGSTLQSIGSSLSRGVSVPGTGSGFGAGNSELSGLFGGQADSLYNMLMQRAGQTLTPSAKDPIIANQVNAYSAQQQRASRNYLDDLAESRGPISNMSAEKRLAAEQEGQSTGAFQANLMGKEIDARRQEIQQALSGMQGMLSDEQRLALQRELEYLNMSQRAYEFDTNDEFRRSPLAS